MRGLGQAWSTKVFLVHWSHCQPTGDESLIKRVEAVPMMIMFEEKSEGGESYHRLSLLIALMILFC